MRGKDHLFYLIQSLSKSEKRYFTLGIDHPFEVKSDDTPSLLPEGAIEFTGR